MPAKNDIRRARVIDLPKKHIRKNVALTHCLKKMFAKYSRIAKILEFQGASFTWQWERPQITVKAN